MNHTFNQYRKLMRCKSKRFWFFLILFCCWQPSLAVGQIIPDGSLPNNSIINSEGNLIRIDGGTTAGSNLFHSLSEFSVTAGTEAFFNNAVNIENILTRVTGNNISNIDGLIRANGAANLFLINPNGIVFGNNARLAIGGSFFGSTANSLLFPDGLEFNANLGTQSESPLLSVNVPIGLQMGENSGTISVNGTGVSDIVPTDNFGLAVAPGQTFALVGNDVNFNGGIVTAPSGRIEIGSVGSDEVGIVQTPVGFQLNYDDVSEFGNIQLGDRSSLFSPAIFDNPLSGINVTGKNIVLDGSQIISLTNSNANSGNITVNAAESLELGGTISAFPFSSWIVNQVAPGATGNSGEIQVIAPQVSINNGARIQTLSQGAGAAGNVSVEAAKSINIAGFALPPDLNLEESAIDPETLLEQNTNSRISSENYAGGAGGNLRISAGDIALLSGGQISTLAGGQGLGSGGKVTVNANRITGENVVSFNPVVFSGIGSYTLGNAAGGNVEISANNVTLLDGAEIFSLTQGSGKGGDIILDVSGSLVAVELNSQIVRLPSGIVSFTFGSGDGGNIETSAGHLDLSSGARLTSLVFIQFLGGFVPDAGTGNAGDVTVRADTIDLGGISDVDPLSASQLSSLSFGSGDAANVDVSARQISIVDAAAIVSVTAISSTGEALPGSGTGNTGNVVVDASESIEIAGFSSFNSQNSFLGTASGGTGNAGNTLVRSPRIVLREGGSLGSTIGATGSSGQAIVNADEIAIDGAAPTGIPAQIGASAVVLPEDFQAAFLLPALPSGNTGQLTVNADRLNITNGGQVSVEHPGTGNAGQLQINVDRLNLDSGGNINATTAFGFGGNVEINVRDSLQLRNGSAINVEALGDIGDGGNLTINADTVVALENSDIVANAVGGNGGNINITTQGIFGTRFRPSLTPESDITASSQLGVDGTVEVNTPDTEPTSGLLELSSTLSDPSDRILSGCAADEGNEFYIIGRGGIPNNPLDAIEGRAIWQDMRTSTRNRIYSRNPVSEPVSPIVEATGWVVDADGSVKLVARAAELNAQSPWYQPTDCGDFSTRSTRSTRSQAQPGNAIPEALPPVNSQQKTYQKNY